MSRIRVLGAALPLGLTVLAACDRSEHDRAGETGVAREQAVVKHERSVPTRPSTDPPEEAPADRPACLVPLPATPAPAAEPAAECPEDPGTNRTLDRGWVVFDEAPASPRVAVEHARTPASRQRGLMYRTSLGEDEGMLFTWPSEAVRSFWMRNTCLPLDMLFLSEEGVILGIVEQVPVLNDTPRSIPCPAAHVLEVNAGWCRAHGVEPGQHAAFDL